MLESIYHRWIAKMRCFVVCSYHVRCIVDGKKAEEEGVRSLLHFAVVVGARLMELCNYLWALSSTVNFSRTSWNMWGVILLYLVPKFRRVFCNMTLTKMQSCAWAAFQTDVPKIGGGLTTHSHRQS
jgi:hypothetical protein